MKYNGENFIGTLFCQLIEQKISEITFEDIQKIADAFLSEAKETDPSAKLVVSLKDVKKACKRKKAANVSFDKKGQKVVFNEISINAYYQLHWAYEAMSLRLYGEDFAERVLKCAKKFK